MIKIVFWYHENEDILGMWGPDAAPLPPNVALRWFSIAVATFVSFGFVTKYALVADRPAIPREYPFSGLVTELGGLEENQVSSNDYQTSTFIRLLPFSVPPSEPDFHPTRNLTLTFYFFSISSSPRRLGQKASMTQSKQVLCTLPTRALCKPGN